MNIGHTLADFRDIFGNSENELLLHCAQDFFGPIPGTKGRNCLLKCPVLGIGSQGHGQGCEHSACLFINCIWLYLCISSKSFVD